MFGNTVYVFILLGIIYQFKYFICVSGNRIEKMCDPKEFYNPYVKILRKRGGPPVFQIQSAGFVDLRNQYGVLLCVNGPAYIYKELHEEQNLTSKVPTLTVFGNNETKVEFFKHQCFLINRPVKVDEDKKPAVEPMDNTGVDSEARETFHRVGSAGNPASLGLLNPKMEVHGIRAYGVTLLGARGNYSNSSLYMFIQPYFGHNDKLLVISSSFVTIGKNAWKAHDKFTNTSLMIKPNATADFQLCSRHQDANNSFDKVFRRAHDRDDYNWTIIPLPDSEKLKEEPTTTPAPPTQPPKDTRKGMQRIGRIIDPVLLGLGFSPSSHPFGGHVKTGDPNNPNGGGGVDGNGTLDGNHTYLYEFPEDYDDTIPKPFRRYLEYTGNCIPLPNPGDSDICKNKAAPEESCKILKSVLQLNPPPVIDKTVPPGTEPKANITWKKEILTIVEDTFTKLCLLINKQSVAAAGSVFFGTYIEAVHAANATLSMKRDDRWTNLLREMKHCQTEAKPLIFTEVAGQPEEEALAAFVLPTFYLAPDENGTALKPGTLEPGNVTEEIAPEAPQKPRSLTVQRYDDSQAPLFHYEEAAEADFEFNVAIDFQWKMFSTVLGYCNKLYASKKSSVFPILLSLFIDDFLNLDPKNWVDPSQNHVFSFFMGESNIWLDECMEGSYIHSDSEEYRPVRPININGGQHLNHFTKTPPHT